MLDLLSGLAKGFAKSQQDQLDEQDKRDLRQLQIKSFKRDLEAKDQMEQAKKGLLALLSPAVPATPGAPEQYGAFGDVTAPAVPGSPGKPAVDLRSALQSPQGQNLALQAGYNPADIKKFQQLSVPELLASMQTNGALAGAVGAPGNAGGAGGMQFSGMDVDAEGNAKLKFDTSSVKSWAVSPDGKTEIGYDERGRPVAQRPVGADKRSKEDEPILSAAKDYQDEQGKNPPSTMTWRELSQGGYKPIGDKVTPEQGGRIAGLIQGQEQVKTLRNALIDKNGKVNKELVFQMSDLGPIEGMPLTEGRTLRQNTEFAISSIVYTRSGAAMPPIELKKTLNQLLPSPLDNEKGVKEKLDRLDQFLGGTLDVITLPPAIKAAYEKRKAEEKSAGSGKKSDPLGIRR